MKNVRKCMLQDAWVRINLYTQSLGVTLSEDNREFITTELKLAFLSGEIHTLMKSLDRLEKLGGEKNVASGS